MNSFGIDLHPMNKTPPPQTFSPSRGDQHNQATPLRQYHNPFSRQVVSPWQQDRYLNDHSDGNAGFISGFGLTQSTPPDNSSSPSSLEWSSQYSTADSYGSSHTSFSQSLGSNSPRSTQSGSSPENSYKSLLTGMPLVASPDGLAAAAFSPTLLHYRSGSAAQATAHTTHLPNDYFTNNLHYSQYPVRQEHQPASSPQYQEPYPSLDTSSLMPALPPPPPPPHQPTHHAEEGGAVADQPSPSPYECGCGTTFGRWTDLKRHQETAKEHGGDRRGPACPVAGCRFTSKFTRPDNFRTHCKKQHGMSVDEINTYIKEWKERRMA